MPETSRAVVVGGGIGGLAAGIALGRAGWRVTVLEREDTPGEIGAGISLWPNALAALDALDVWPDIASAATMQLGGARRPDGRWLVRVDAADPPFTVLLVHRAQLHRKLMAALPDGAMVAGANVRAVTPDGQVRYDHEGQSVGVSADLVVAADGLRSGIRQEWWPDYAGERYAGFTAWRGVTTEPFPLDAGSETWGPGSVFGATILLDGRVYWFATANLPEDTRFDDEHAEVLRRFDGWHVPLTDLVRATAPSAVLRHDIFTLTTPLPELRRGRIVLLGDAAHAMTPNLGQGACQALEDAVTLGALVASRDVDDALAAYDAERRPRTQHLVTMSARAGRMAQAQAPAVVSMRNLLARLVPVGIASRPIAKTVAWRPPRGRPEPGYVGVVTFDSMTHDQVQALHDEQLDAYRTLQKAGLKLDLTRGKPSPEQLDLSAELLSLPGDDYKDSKGTDTRNYGGLNGLPELRAIFAEIMQVPVDQVVAGDNASLGMMHDTLVFSLLRGTPDSPNPWVEEDEVTFICPVPGYDRHFALTERYGVTMVPVEMHDDGPDMAAVRTLAADPTVKGMWLVPTYGNPSGAVVSEAVAAELAALETAAPDFRIFWDNAYSVHHLTEERTKTADIVGLCAASGHPNRAIVFASTSKITFAGSGVCFLGSSEENVEWYLGNLGKRTIGPDKVNQLRHARYLGDVDGVHRLMDQHRAILAPKFAAVLEILRDRLGPHDIATWSEPKGGYFVSLDVADGTASRVVELCREAGIAMTPAGASFPYGDDPRDRNIRIAPSFPGIDELRTAMDGLATCALLAAAEQHLSS